MPSENAPRPVIPERFVEMLDRSGLSQAGLAKRVGISQPSIARLKTGEQYGSRHLHLIARVLETTPEYLTGEIDDPDAGAPPPVLTEDFAAEMGLVAIKEIDLALGAGGTYISDGAVMEVERWFPQKWLREFTDAPPHKLVFARVKGDSMKPSIEHGGIVIIDLRKQRIDEQDSIWAIAIAEIGMVKRIWANADGSYKIKSDNPNVDPETAVDGEMFVIGRVVGGFSKF